MYHTPPLRAWWSAKRLIGGRKGAANLEPGSDNARNNPATIFILPCTDLGNQIVFAMRRPSTRSATPNVGFGGTVLLSLPAFCLCWVLPAGVSRVKESWVDGLWACEP